MLPILAIANPHVLGFRCEPRQLHDWQEELFLLPFLLCSRLIGAVWPSIMQAVRCLIALRAATWPRIRVLPLLHHIEAVGQSSGLTPGHLERSISTSCSCALGEDVGSSRLWSRANFARSKFASGYTALAPKKLEQIMKIETVIFSTPEEITEIWNNYHIGRGHISAVMGSELYKALEERANDCPLFVLPLRKGTGFISIVVQAQMPYMLFTALEDYMSRGTEASPYFTVTHFTDMVSTKGLVLVRGDIVFTSKLSDDEAETLLKTAHSFYINDDRYRKVWCFNKDSKDFDFNEVLRELNIPL